MKKIYLLPLLIGALFFQACEGPMGPPGIDGMDGVDGVDGEDGGLFLSTVLETSVNFTEEEGFQAAFNLEIYEDDNLMIYKAIGADEEENIVWMPLPQTLFLEDGLVIYNYYFTSKFFSIFMDSSIPPADLPAEYTNDQYFRIVVIPGQFAEESARIDWNDYRSVMKWLGKEENDIQKIAPTLKNR